MSWFAGTGSASGAGQPPKMFICCSAATLLYLETDCCSPLSRQLYLLRKEPPNNAML